MSGQAPALAMVSASMAKFCVDNQLHEFKVALKVDLCDLLYSLRLKPATFETVLATFPNVKAFESATRDQIQVKLSPSMAGELIAALTAAGKTPA